MENIKKIKSDNSPRLNSSRSNYEARHGREEGKNLALVNVRYDIEALDLISYTRPILTIQADIIEFID